jgi:hypothetical protein
MAKNVLVVDYNHYDLPDKISEDSLKKFGGVIAEEISKQKEKVNYLIVPSGQIVDIVCTRGGTLENYFSEALNEKIKNSKIRFISSGFGYHPERAELKERLEKHLGKLKLLNRTSLEHKFVLYKVIIPKK